MKDHENFHDKKFHEKFTDNENTISKPLITF